MADAGAEIQKGILARLKAVAGVTSLVPAARILAHVPQGTAYPLIVVGDDVGGDFSGKGFDGQEYELTIHAWTEARGSGPVKQILSAIHEALHNQPSAVTVTGWSLFLLQYRYSTAFIDETIAPDTDKYYHGVIRFRALLIEQ